MLNTNEYDKVFIFDTNILIHDPQSIFKFQDRNLICIPMAVLEEVDTFKKGQDEKSRNSRQFSRYLDNLRKTGDISKGVPLDNGGYLKIDVTNFSTKDIWTDNTIDNKILNCAREYKKTNKKVTLISKDINMRIKANSLGILAEDYQSDKVRFEEMYTGVTVFETTSEIINEVYQNKEIDFGYIEGLPEMFPNQYVVLKCSYSKQKAIARYHKKTNSLIAVIDDKHRDIWGIRPKNLEQTIALDMLMNDDIKLVSLVGKAGTGKTLLSVATGLFKSLEMERYKKLLVSRPIIPLGRDLGFLPGDVNEKMEPWIRPIKDSMAFIFGGKQNKDSKHQIRDLFENDFVSIEPLTYIRGRSIPNQFIVIDEAQNLTPHEVKTIISRTGEGSKIVLTGDCYQIDNPYVDACSNGLSHVVENLKDEEIVGHITLLKGERSELAEIASNKL